MRQSELEDYQSSESKDPWRDEDLLRELYVRQELSFGDLAKRWDCTRQTPARWADKFGIKKRPSRSESTGPWQDKETLQEMYINQGMSLRKVADELGTDHTNIDYWLENNGIEKRTAYQEYGHAPFVTDHQGYERWKTYVDGTHHRASVHRLLAVAEYGFDAVCGMDVHHKNEIRWDNRPENIEVVDPSEHRSYHNLKQSGKISQVSKSIRRDESGKFTSQNAAESSGVN